MEREPDHRVDIFALGVLLFEALTGGTPGDPFRAPSEIRPELDPRYDEVVMRSMQPVPADRYQSCREFLQALKEVVTTPRPPVKGQLLTGGVVAKPGSGPVTAPLNTPAVAPVATAAMPAAPVPTAQVVDPEAVTQQVPQEAPMGPPQAKKKPMVLIWIVVVLAVILAVVVGMILSKQSGEKAKGKPEPEGPTAAELAGNAGGGVRNGETPQERVERIAREQLERLKKLEEEKKKNPPKDKKDPKKDKKKDPKDKEDPKKKDGEKPDGEKEPEEGE
jgi:hypothetical protein